MHKNLIWQGFLAIVFATTLWFSVVALYAYFSYSQLKTQIFASKIDWNVEEKNDEEFFLKAFYHFNFKGHSYSGTTIWKDDLYRNHYAAEQGLNESSKQHQKVWFNPENPHYSSLQKNFPFKECISAFFLWCLLLYFLWLGFYVTKFKS